MKWPLLVLASVLSFDVSASSEDLRVSNTETGFSESTSIRVRDVVRADGLTYIIWDSNRDAVMVTTLAGGVVTSPDGGYAAAAFGGQQNFRAAAADGADVMILYVDYADTPVLRSVKLNSRGEVLTRHTVAEARTHEAAIVRHQEGFVALYTAGDRVVSVLLDGSGRPAGSSSIVFTRAGALVQEVEAASLGEEVLVTVNYSHCSGSGCSSRIELISLGDALGVKARTELKLGSDSVRAIRLAAGADTAVFVWIDMMGNEIGAVNLTEIGKGAAILRPALVLPLDAPRTKSLDLSVNGQSVLITAIENSELIALWTSTGSDAIARRELGDVNSEESATALESPTEGIIVVNVARGTDSPLVHARITAETTAAEYDAAVRTTRAASQPRICVAGETAVAFWMERHPDQWGVWKMFARNLSSGRVAELLSSSSSSMPALSVASSGSGCAAVVIGGLTLDAIFIDPSTLIGNRQTFRATTTLFGRPEIAWTGDHYLAAWNDSRSGNPYRIERILGRRFTEQGESMDAEPFVLVDSSSSAIQPELASNGTSTLLVYHEGNYVRWQGFVGEIRALPLNSDGTPAGSASTLALTQRASPIDLAAAPDGTFLLVYQSHAVYWLTGARQILAVRLDARGVELDDRPIVISDADTVSHVAAVIWNSSAFDVVWEERRIIRTAQSFLAPSDIMMRHVDVAGGVSGKVPPVTSEQDDFLGNLGASATRRYIAYGREAPESGSGPIMSAFVNIGPAETAVTRHTPMKPRRRP